MKFLMKCGYCRKKRIYPVSYVEKRKGLVFCSRKCYHNFSKILRHAHNVIWVDENKEFLTVGDKKIIKREKQILLDNINDKIDRLILEEYY